MIQIKCEGCNNHCCGKNPHLTPVLLSSEEKKFKEYSKKIKTPYRTMSVLVKKGNRNCIFLDDKTKKCDIYNKRPLECMLYPFLLDFETTVLNVRLDKRFCPHLKTLAFDKEKIIDLISKYKFPSSWIEGYKALKDF
jgi:Fe-S-cluster containining protein